MTETRLLAGADGVLDTGVRPVASFEELRGLAARCPSALSWTNSSRKLGCMDYTNLGRSGLSVSRIVLGTMNFGPETSEEDSFAIMDSAHQRGVNFFDTSVSTV